MNHDRFIHPRSRLVQISWKGRRYFLGIPAPRCQREQPHSIRDWTDIFDLTPTRFTSMKVSPQ